MRLLVVDDEQLTREGIISIIEWDKLGITEILEADDGLNGIQIARQNPPDVILCDVRMPRMDGIAMLEKMEALYPDTPAIFMSGYSDKEYLKAAIHLKVISYIEKPIDPKEMQEAISQAIEQRQYKMRQRQAEQIHSNLTATQLAYQLTIPYNHCTESVNELCAQLRKYYGTDKFKYVTTIVVRHQELTDAITDVTYIHKQIREFLKPMHLHVIYSEKRDCHIVYHIYGELEPARSTWIIIANRFCELLSEMGKFYIAIGNTVNGISMAYQSYETAVILLQSSFFFEPGTVLSTEVLEKYGKKDFSILSSLAEQYMQIISEKEEEKAIAVLADIVQHCQYAVGILPNQVKSIYYEMFSSLYKVRKKNQLLPDFSMESHENIMDMIQTCFSFLSLHQLLGEKTHSYFRDLEQVQPENSVIYLIRDFINNHYMDANLSVKEIGEHVNLSLSYVCTFFKNCTGVTLNQYITEFRLEKAKQLLANPRYRITDISTTVGYSDGNYFSKSFRKYTGLSPSEFREKTLK